MTSGLSITLSAALVALFSIGSTSIAAGLPKDARYLTQQELFQMYVNRSWKWSDGAGFYRNKQRHFKAYSNENGEPSVATGIWFLPWQGKVCFRAQWKGKDYVSKKTSCFGHRMATNGVIWQRREPDGEWYVFRNNPRKRADEINKLILGDLVSKGHLRNEKAIAR